MSIDVTITYGNKEKRELKIPYSVGQTLTFNKDMLATLNINQDDIIDFDIRIFTETAPIIIVENDFDGEHFGISSYKNRKASISLLKLYNVPLIHLNDLNIDTVNTYYSSPLIVRCKVNDLYTGCEVHDAHMKKKAIENKEYSIDIRRDSYISKFSADGVFTINVQESEIKECSIINMHDSSVLKRIHLWHGSKVSVLSISAKINTFSVDNCSIETLTLGPTEIEEINLNQDQIGQCFATEASFSNTDLMNENVDKWRLLRKAAIHNGNRKLYVNASYNMNTCYTKSASQWIDRVKLKLFSLICGYGYKPLRVLFASLIGIVVFGFVYYIIAIASTNAFQESFDFMDGLYFSGITFTTIGFGDIEPLSTAIRLLTILEGIIGIGMLSLFIFTLTKTLTENIRE